MEFIAGTSEHLPEHNISPARPFHRTDIAELHGRAVQIHEHLIQFGNAVEHVRSESVTPLQRALHHLQCAYRSFQGWMVGVPDKLLDCGESTPRGSIRHLLLSSLSFYCCHAPIDEPGVLEEPAPQGLWKFSSLSPPVVANSGCMTAESLSALFERGERLHSSVVEKLRGITHQPATSAHSIHIQEQLSHVQTHLLERHVDLHKLLDNAGHRRTGPMNLAHDVFMALGHAEGAMIGAERRFESTCQPLMDVISARTTELSRYC